MMDADPVKVPVVAMIVPHPTTLIAEPVKREISIPTRV
jgi:hypothetical protein